MKEFYEQVLKPLNPKEIYQKLDNSILLCYEEHNEFCHRHIVSAWFELTLGIEVLEVKIDSFKEEVVDRPEYIKKITPQKKKKNKKKI